MSITRLAGVPSNPLDPGYSPLDYGGCACSPSGDLLLFGGGHAATAIPDMWRLSSDWVSEYPVPSRAQVEAAWGTPQVTSTKWLNIPGFQPMPATVHAYSGNVWSHAINRFLKTSQMAGGYSNSNWPIVQQSIGEYDPVTKTWTDTGVIPPWEGPTAVCEDPVSGCIIAIINAGFWVYDPRTRKIVHADDNTSGLLGYDDHLVYFPPTDKFYLITRGYGWANPPCPHVIEITIDRTTWSRSLRDTGYSRPATTTNPVAGILGYVYDPVAQMIVGGVDSDVMHGFRPDKGWFAHPAPGAGSMYFHHIAYDEKNQRVLFLTLHDTMAFKGEAALWQPLAGLDPDVKAVITGNGTVYDNLEDACNAAVPLTIGPGVLRTGGATTHIETTFIHGAGLDKTSIVGGAVWGQAQIVVAAPGPLSVSGITFQEAFVSDNNGAGIRHDTGILTLTDSKFLRCQMGYLSGGPVHQVVINNCVFEGCGTGVPSPSIGHGIYIGHNCTDAQVSDCQFRGTVIGHHFKSRAIKTKVSRCVMEPATESYSMDFPWAGEVSIDNCTMTQGVDTDNDVMVNYGSENDREKQPIPFLVDSFSATDCVLRSNDIPHATGFRFDATRYPNVKVTLTRVQFIGIETPVLGGVVTYKDCTKDGVPIPNTDGSVVVVPPAPPGPNLRLARLLLGKTGFNTTATEMNKFAAALRAAADPKDQPIIVAYNVVANALNVAGPLIAAAIVAES